MTADLHASATLAATFVDPHGGVISTGARRLAAMRALRPSFWDAPACHFAPESVASRTYQLPHFSTLLTRMAAAPPSCHLLAPPPPIADVRVSALFRAGYGGSRSAAPSQRRNSGTGMPAKRVGLRGVALPCLSSVGWFGGCACARSCSCVCAGKSKSPPAPRLARHNLCAQRADARARLRTMIHIYNLISGLLG